MFFSSNFSLVLIFIKIYIFLVLINISSANETCFKDDDGKCTTSMVDKYSKESNKFSKYLVQVEKAKQEYRPCNNTNCGCFKSTRIKDLRPFKDGISKEDIEKVKTKGTKYQIISHRLYRDNNCMFPARCMGIEHFLLALLPQLPDMEFILNPRDWPQIHKDYGIFGPIFSFSKTEHYKDIMYPAWAFWEGGPAINLYPRGIGRWDLHRKELGKEGNRTSWENKKSKAFFRGSRTSAERDPLVYLSRENPDLVDAQYTKNQAWKSDADTLHAPPAAEVSFKEHCAYKYLFNFRGVAASFRFKHILLCKSLVFHVGDEWLEFFYSSLLPWIHYIPVKANAKKEEIEELIEFAVHHDNISKEIAENGYNMIWNNLKLKDVTCYWLKLLKNYAKLLNYTVELDKTLMEIRNK